MSPKYRLFFARLSPLRRLFIAFQIWRPEIQHITFGSWQQKTRSTLVLRVQFPKNADRSQTKHRSAYCDTFSASCARILARPSEGVVYMAGLINRFIHATSAGNVLQTRQLFPSSRPFLTPYNGRGTNQRTSTKLPQKIRFLSKTLRKIIRHKMGEKLL